jgi:enoyl-CoA hydratase/carnithine racemase
MNERWLNLKTWPELILERMEGSGLARITFNRPEKRNALTGTLVQAFFEALEILREDDDIKVIITRGAGPVYSAGLDLHFLRGRSHGKLSDWDRPTITIRLTEALLDYPKILIAQVHGYCLGGSLGLMNAHDLVFASASAQIGMPEMPRGSFGQIATSTLFHSGVPIKKAAFMALTARNVSGVEADRLGLISLCTPDDELEATTVSIALEIASRHAVPLQHHKIAVQMGRDLSLKEAMRVDQLVGARQARGMDPVMDIEAYLKSQKGGTNLAYKRPDV